MKAKYTTNAECTIKNIRNYLKKCNYNIIVEEDNVDFPYTSSCFIYESNTRDKKDKKFVLKIDVDDINGFAVLDAYVNICIPRPQREIAAKYCMRKIGERKLSSIAFNAESGYVFTRIESSFADAPLSESTLSNMEHIALSTLFACYDDLEQIAKGEFVENNNENDDFSDDEFFEILKELANEYKQKANNQNNDDPDEETA